MTWSKEAKAALIQWSQYQLPSWRTEKLGYGKNSNRDEKLFELIHADFLDNTPTDLKRLCLMSDADFDSWANERAIASRDLLRLFTLSGDIPSFSYQRNESQHWPILSSVGRWTAMNEMIKYLKECGPNLEAVRAFREDFLAKIRGEYMNIVSAGLIKQ